MTQEQRRAQLRAFAATAGEDENNPQMRAMANATASAALEEFFALADAAGRVAFALEELLVHIRDRGLG